MRIVCVFEKEKKSRLETQRREKKRQTTTEKIGWERSNTKRARVRLSERKLPKSSKF